MIIILIVLLILFIILCNWKSFRSYFSHKNCSDITINDFADEVFLSHITSTDVHPISHFQNSEGHILVPLERKGDLFVSIIVNLPIKTANLVANTEEFEITGLDIGHDDQNYYINLNYLPIDMLPYEKLFVRITTDSKITPKISYRVAEVDDKCADFMAEGTISVGWRPNITGKRFYVSGGQLMTKEK